MGREGGKRAEKIKKKEKWGGKKKGERKKPNPNPKSGLGASFANARSVHHQQCWQGGKEWLLAFSNQPSPLKGYRSLPARLVSCTLEFGSRALPWQREAAAPVSPFPVHGLGPGCPSLRCAAGIGASSPVHAPASAPLSDWTVRSTVHQ